MSETVTKEANILTPVLCVNAHPDDESFGFGGVIAKFRQINRPVYVTSLTCGEAGESGIVLSKQLSLVRKNEFFSAGTSLGISPERMLIGNLPDGQLSKLSEKVDETILRFFHKYQPGLILTMHPKSTSHPDHIAIANSVIRLWQYGQLPNTSIMLQYLPNKYTPSETEISVTVPVDEFLQRKIDAIRQHQSQSTDAERIIPKLLTCEYFILSQ